MSLTKKYLSASIVGLIGKAFNMISMLGILWLLNAILDKEGFGLFMVAFSLMFTIAMVIASGFQSLLIYHVSRLVDQDDEEKITAITSQIFWMVIIISLLASIIIYSVSAGIELLMELPDLSTWLKLMALFIPAHAAAIVLPTLPLARHNSERTVFYQEILLNALRVLFLAIIWISGAAIAYIAGAYIISAIIPVVLVFIKYPSWPRVKNLPLTLWDFKYVGKISLFQLLNQPFRGFDVLLVGAFASAGAVADYTMATRLAQLLWIPKHAVSQLQVPRMGALLDKKDYTQLMHEYNAMRTITLFFAMGGCAFLALLGSWLLSFFGNYSGAYSILMLLALAAVIRTGVGASGSILSQSGHAGWSAIMASVSMVTTIVMSVILIPVIGADGGGWAVFVGTIVLFAGFWAVIYKILALNTITFMSFIVMAIASAVLIMPINSILAAFLIVSLAFILLALDRSWLRFLKDNI